MNAPLQFNRKKCKKLQSFQQNENTVFHQKILFLLQCQTPVSQPSDQSEANRADNTKTMINRHRPLHYDHICNPCRHGKKAAKS